MPVTLYAAGGLALVSGFLLWRLMAANRKIGALKMIIKTYQNTHGILDKTAIDSLDPDERKRVHNSLRVKPH